KPTDYSTCSKLPGTDYAEPAAKPHKPAARTEPAKAIADSVKAEPAKPDAAKPDAHGPDSAKANPPDPQPPNLPPVKPRPEYKSSPASLFADVSSELRLNGEAPSKVAPNATERPDNNTQVRRGAVYKVARANGTIEYTNVRPAGGPYQMLFTYIATCYACDVK